LRETGGKKRRGGADLLGTKNQKAAEIRMIGVERKDGGLAGLRIPSKER